MNSILYSSGLSSNLCWIGTATNKESGRKKEKKRKNRLQDANISNQFKFMTPKITVIHTLKKNSEHCIKIFHHTSYTTYLELNTLINLLKSSEFPAQMSLSSSIHSCFRTTSVTSSKASIVLF